LLDHQLWVVFFYILFCLRFFLFGPCDVITTRFQLRPQLMITWISNIKWQFSVLILPHNLMFLTTILNVDLLKLPISCITFVLTMPYTKLRFNGLKYSLKSFYFAFFVVLYSIDKCTCCCLVSSFTFFLFYFEAEECNKCLLFKITNILFHYKKIDNRK